MPTQRPTPPELRKSLDALLHIIPADLVFCYDHCLYIVPNPHAPETLHSYKVKLEGADWLPAHYTFALYDLEDIRQGIDAGKLFHNTVFTPDWLVYNSGCSALPLPLPLRVAQTERYGRETFAFGLRQSRTCCKCAASLTEPDEAGLAAFLLHQSVELLLRAFIIAVTGQEVKSHTLADLMKHTLRYAPGLKSCDTSSGRPLHQLPERLEKAYVGGRYSPHFQMAPSALPELREHVALLQQALEIRFRDLMRGYGHERYEAPLISIEGKQYRPDLSS